MDFTKYKYKFAGHGFVALGPKGNGLRRAVLPALRRPPFRERAGHHFMTGLSMNDFSDAAGRKVISVCKVVHMHPFSVQKHDFPVSLKVLGTGSVGFAPSGPFRVAAGDIDHLSLHVFLKLHQQLFRQYFFCVDVFQTSHSFRRGVPGGPGFFHTRACLRLRVESRSIPCGNEKVRNGNPIADTKKA